MCCELRCASHVSVLCNRRYVLTAQWPHRRPSSCCATPGHSQGGIAQSSVSNRWPTQAPSDILGSVHALIEGTRLHGSWNPPAATTPLHDARTYASRQPQRIMHAMTIYLIKHHHFSIRLPTKPQPHVGAPTRNHITHVSISSQKAPWLPGNAATDAGRRYTHAYRAGLR